MQWRRKGKKTEPHSISRHAREDKEPSYVSTKTKTFMKKESCSPGVLYGLFTGVACNGINVHEVTDEVLGGIRDIVPVGGVKFIVPPHDLLEQLRIVLVVEWRVATKTGQVGGVKIKEGVQR